MEHDHVERKVEGIGQASNGTMAADPEVAAVAKRRILSDKYKLRIVEEADRCKKPGEIGLLLRREGLYSSQLYHWRKLREEMAKRRGRNMGKDQRVREMEKENARLQRELVKAEFKLKRAEGMLELQKKAAALFAQLEEQNGRSE